MPLAPGQFLSFYEILGPLGVGGMGEVYRARDTRLRREVAIKVLPDELADDEERLRRFEREARTLASLNHPNIAGIHGVDQVDGVGFLALELVPGEDLATRLSRGPLPVGEAIDVCRQIAEGLEAAHEAGVVHRDLKPANVRITPDGVVKILDFGLAKPIRPKMSQQGTTSAEADSFLLSEEGLVLGTPTYMSPEQARGRPVDRRTDIWAFGCLLYECLSGVRTFGQGSVPEILAAILEREPDWNALPGSTPPWMVSLVRRCLDKDARTRLRDMGEARVQLALERNGPVPPAGGGPQPLGLGSLRGVALLVAVASLSGAAGLWLGRRPSADTNARAAPSRRAFNGTVLDFDEDATVTDATMSPDGTRVAWVDGEGLHVRAIARRDPWTVVQDPRLGQHIAWSPDGRDLAYILHNELWTVAAGGGTPRRVGAIDDFYYWSPLQWTADQGIVYSTLEALVGLSEAGERTVRVEFDERISHLHEFLLLPDGSGAIVVPHVVGGWPESIDVLRDGRRKELVATRGEEPNLCWLAADGSLFWAGSKGMMKLPLSEDFEPRGDEELVLSGVLDAEQASDGTLCFTTGQSELHSQLGWIDARDGAFSPIGEPHGDIWGGSLSADGKRILFTVNPGSVSETRILDVERNVSTPWIQRTDGSALAGFLPDGRIQVWPVVAEDGVYVYEASGEGDPEHLDELVVNASPDGEVLVTTEPVPPGAAAPTFASGPGMTGGRRQILGEEHREEFCDLSRDGGWMLYASERAGRLQVYLARFPPEAGESWPVSAEGGEEAWFTANTDAIFFRSERGMYRVSLELEPSVRLGAPVRLFSLSPRVNLTDFDGSGRFLGIRWRFRSKIHVDSDWGEAVVR